MSIATSLSRIVTLRNAIRDKLVAMGLVNAAAKLADCKTAIVGITDNTKKTTTTNAVSGTYYSGTTGKIYGRPGAGYCAAGTVVSIPVTNLAAENIKKGVNVGGVVGTVAEEFNEYATFKCSSQATYLKIYDATGVLYDSQVSGNNDVLSFTGSHKVKGSLVIMLAVNRSLRSGTDFKVVNCNHQYISLGIITGPNPVISSG